MAGQIEDNLIADLTSGGDTPPLRIRVLRKWSPPFRKSQTCFIFIDKEVSLISIKYYLLSYMV